MSDNNNNFIQIEEKILLQLKKSKSALISTTFVYVILVLIVIAYSIYVTSNFKTLATPANVAGLLTMKIEDAIPAVNSYLKENSQVLATNLADQTVEHARSMVPAIGIMAKSRLNMLADHINNEFNTKYLPEVDRYFKNHKEDIIKNINMLSNKEAAELLANELIEQVDFGLLEIANEFNDSVLSFKREINYLSHTKNNKLTKKELAHKKVIAYWVYLLKHAETGEMKI